MKIIEDVLCLILTDFLLISEWPNIARVCVYWRQIIGNKVLKLKEEKIKLCISEPYNGATGFKEIYKKYPVCLRCFITDTKPDTETVLKWFHDKKLGFGLCHIDKFTRGNKLCKREVRKRIRCNFDPFPRGPNGKQIQLDFFKWFLSNNMLYKFLLHMEWKKKLLKKNKQPIPLYFTWYIPRHLELPEGYTCH